jgi:16S rRNA (guanine(966)-N(2))-methyltransferase RsmD
VRQTLFDILAPEIAGARFLDLCAGGGGVGLEALSRGASRVVLVDRSAGAVEAIRANAAALSGLGGEVEVFRQEALAAAAGLAAAGRTFDIVFLDPPYESGLYEPLLERTGERLLAEGGVAVAEHFHKRELPARIGGLVRARSVRIGDHRLSFYRREG